MAVLSKDISETRRLNRQKVFETLYFSPTPLSKKELSEKVDLSFPTVNQNIAELCDAEIIKELKSNNFTGGRHANVLAINELAYYSLGISINNETIRFILTDLRLNELGYKKIKYNLNSFEREIGTFLAKEIDNFISELSVERSKILGVGIAIPGIIDRKLNKVVFSPTLKIENLSCDVITNKIPFVTYVENDGSAGGQCEYFVGDKFDNMAYISLENGVGGSIIISGNNYLGDNAKAAEFGHTCVMPNGLDCSCGNKGCLEAYCKPERFSVDLGISLDTFITELKGGNPKHKALVDDMLKNLAVAIANIRSTLDCHVVIGGFLTILIDPYFDELKSYLKNNLRADKDTNFLSLCKHRNKSVPMGMSLYFIKKFIKSI